METSAVERATATAESATTTVTTVDIESPDQELYLFNKRDEEERDRLDGQSSAIRVIRDGHILDPRIPKQNVSRVADVATGTGIWLRELAEEFENGGYNLQETVGFDISPGQFPKNAASEHKFVLWDMTKSFPKEYYGTFDVVHVRLVVLALKAEQIKGVVENLVELLKPGGYLQWTDVSYRNGLKMTHSSDESDPLWKAGVDQMFKYCGDLGFSFDPPDDVEKILQNLPVEDVHVTDHTFAPSKNPEINDLVVEWQSRTIALSIQLLSSRNGLSAEEAKMAAYLYRKKAVDMGKRGVIWRSPMATLVARKK
ncbi:uncharacterized protein EAE98_008710 [Botrytis deweyae]|uniref:Methyltransferase type 12 domain-containing protein n=1 Tax=Botrytis deweyae TaxID=2478750 RepID=A0ABQ7IDX5_9HELO|nr:uncharacterized protein EAE98_008710 [Botrytis deweyae]KAF7921284.1 hypothetical protein EAE98_008710 [Botrytis deweyae]